MKNLLALTLVFLLTVTLVSSRPTLLRRQKRQSDQRIAELETLLALQKYGHHRLHDYGRLKENGLPGYGLIDFDKIGRRKKSTRFSPGAPQNNFWNSWMEDFVVRHPLSSTSGSANAVGSLESQLDQK